jgi:hypothetical protein
MLVAEPSRVPPERERLLTSLSATVRMSRMLPTRRGLGRDDEEVRRIAFGGADRASSIGKRRAFVRALSPRRGIKNMPERTRPMPWVRLGLVSLSALMLMSTRTEAQQLITWRRARDACNAAAVRAGYVILRRDHESFARDMYVFPMHVRRGNDESDVTCRYDGVRGLVDLPEVGRERTEAGSLETMDQRAERRCENFLNSTAGYQVQNVGPAVRHGRLWDVTLTVRRHGRDGIPMTCRYNPSSNKLTIRSSY